jgi:hypothetical protein
MTKVPARRNPSLLSLSNDRQGGDFVIVRDKEVDENLAMWFCCPCGCGSMGRLPLRPSNAAHSWEWNGNEEQPTLHPSVHHQIGDGAGGLQTHWHGWLKAGVWESC